MGSPGALPGKEDFSWTMQDSEKGRMCQDGGMSQAPARGGHEVGERWQASLWGQNVEASDKSAQSIQVNLLTDTESTF